MFYPNYTQEIMTFNCSKDYLTVGSFISTGIRYGYQSQSEYFSYLHLQKKAMKECLERKFAYHHPYPGFLTRFGPLLFSMSVRCFFARAHSTYKMIQTSANEPIAADDTILIMQTMTCKTLLLQTMNCRGFFCRR